MKIGIIGAGHIGSALAERLGRLGHSVYIANSRGPESLADIAAETGATPVTVREAARYGEVVVVTIPESKIPELGSSLFAGVPKDVVVVDTGNYYPQQRDGRIAGIEDGVGNVESVWVSEQLGRHVFKAFNNIYAEHLRSSGKAKGEPGRIALPYAGDGEAGKSKLAALIEEIGFDAVDAGALQESWRQQPGTPVYTKDFDVSGVRRPRDAALRERQPEWRGPPERPGTMENPK